MALFDILRRAREREEQRQKTAKVSAQNPIASRISQTREQAPAPVDLARDIARQTGVIPQVQARTAAPRSTPEGRVLPVSERREQVFPVRYGQTPLGDITGVTGLRDNLIRAGRDRAALNAGALAAGRTAFDVVPVRPLAQGLTYFGGRATGRDLAQQPATPARPNVFQDLFLADRQGQISGGPIGQGVNLMTRGVGQSLTAETVSQYLGGLGLFTVGAGMGGADFVPGGRVATEGAENLLRAAARRQAPDFLQEASRLRPAQLTDEGVDVMSNLVRPRPTTPLSPEVPVSRAVRSIQQAENIPRVVREGVQEFAVPRKAIQDTVARFESSIEDPVQAALDFSFQPIRMAADGQLANDAVDEAIAITNKLTEAFEKAPTPREAQLITAAYTEMLDKVAQGISASGRSMRVFQDLIKSSPSRFLLEAEAALRKAGQRGAQVTPLTDVDKARLVELGEQYVKASDDFAKGAIAGEAADLVSRKIPSTVMESMADWFRSSILSGISTTARNVIGLARGTMLDAPTRGLQLTFSQARKMLGGMQTAAVQSAKTGRKAAGQSLRLSWEDFKTGRNSFQTDTMLDSSTSFFKEGDSVVSRTLKTPFEATRRWSLLSTSGGDNARFAAIKAKVREELANLAQKNGIEPTPEVMRRLEELADLESSFKTSINNSILKMFAQGLQKLFSKVDKSNVIGKFIIPIVGVPSNIVSQGIVDYSPLGLLKTIPMYLRAAKETEIDRLIANRMLDEGLSRAMVGSTYIGLGALGGATGIIVTNQRRDRRETDMLRDAGVPALGVNTSAIKRIMQYVVPSDEPIEWDKILEAGKLQNGDTFVDIAPLQPIGMSIAVGRAIQEQVEEGKGNTTVQTVINSLNSALEVALENPAFIAFKQIGEISRDPAGIFAGILGNIATGILTPAIMRDVAFLIDSEVRETRDEDPIKETWNRIKARIPGISTTLPERVTYSGENLSRQRGALPGLGLPTQVLGSVLPRSFEEDPLQTAQREAFEITGDTSALPRNLDRKGTFLSVAYSMDNEQISKYRRILSAGQRQALVAARNAPGWNQLTTTQKVNRIDRYVGEYVTGIKMSAVLEEFGISPAGLTKDQLLNIYESINDREDENGRKLFQTLDLDGKKRVLERAVEIQKR